MARVTLTGRAGADLELRFAPSADEFLLALRIAVRALASVYADHPSWAQHVENESVRVSGIDVSDGPVYAWSGSTSSTFIIQESEVETLRRRCDELERRLDETRDMLERLLVAVRLYTPPSA